MILLLAGGLIILGVVVIGGLGALPTARADSVRESSLFSGTGPLIALVGGVLVVVLLGAALVVGVGLRGDDTDAKSTAPRTIPPATTVTTRAMTTTSVTRTTATQSAVEGTDVVLQATTTDSFGSVPPAVDGLAPRALLRISAAGFEPNSSGFVEQCTVAGCANPFPVRFDETGLARFQYVVGDAFAADLTPPSACDADGLPCVVHLRAGDNFAFLTTIFRDVAPAPRRVSVRPNARGVVDGTPVRVSVTGFSPGEHVEAKLCAAPHTYGPTHCGAPGPVSSFTIGADGAGQTVLVIRGGRIGSAGASCGRGATCGIVVSQATSSVPAPVAQIAFAAGPAARYDPFRWLTGMGVALALLALAFLLARTTDWRKPSEADTPDLDRAAFID